MNITELDFEQLHSTSMRWGNDWCQHKDRFRCFKPINYAFRWAYWFDDYPALMIARQFLENINSEYQEMYDEAMDQYLIVTNYITLTWR